jgi:hypothetical protein
VPPDETAADTCQLDKVTGVPPGYDSIGICHVKLFRKKVVIYFFISIEFSTFASTLKHTMKEKELFIKTIRTLLYSWGSDTPPEAFWGLNDLLDWYEKEYGVSLDIRFDENGDNADIVMESIRNS